MDQVSPVSPPPTPSSATGHLLSKTNTFIKASAKRIAHRTETLPRDSSHRSLPGVSDLLGLDIEPPAAPFSDTHSVHRSRATSTSSPSLPLNRDESPNPHHHQIMHKPSVPSLKQAHRPPKSQPSTSYTNSLSSIWTLTPAEPPPPVTPLEASPRSPERSATMESQARPVDVSDAIVRYGIGNYGMNGSMANNMGNTQNPTMVYQYIHELSAKRVSTLDYLRKAHQGQVYWFNTLLFSRADLMRLPSFDARRLAKRATNYLLLGLSLPTILDLNTNNPMDYLRALNALLAEFETYQQIHPSDGTASSSLSRAKIPQMFKRSTYSTGAKGRRSSSAADIGLPISSSDPSDLKAMAGGLSSVGSSTGSFGASEQELLPGEEYTHLLTPSLPFDPDFFETFATLCDVLIDCYVRITHIVSSPTLCGPGVSEIFAKADARLRKVIVGGIVKEFEDANRGGIKNEIAGIGKVVLGGLL